MGFINQQTSLGAPHCGGHKEIQPLVLDKLCARDHTGLFTVPEGRVAGLFVSLQFQCSAWKPSKSWLWKNCRNLKQGATLMSQNDAFLQDLTYIFLLILAPLKPAFFSFPLDLGSWQMAPSRNFNPIPKQSCRPCRPRNRHFPKRPWTLAFMDNVAYNPQ